MSEITFIGSDFSEPIRHIGMYSDNTPFIKTERFGDIVEHADTLVLRPRTLPAFFAGLTLCGSVYESGGSIRNLILPYLPGARQDRVNPTGDVMATSHVVGKFINMFGFDVVLVADPHSAASTVQIDAVVEYPLENIYSHLWEGYGGVIAPDKGAKFRAAEAGRVLNLPVTTASKVRDVSTGKLSGFDVSVEAGKHYIVVDDICDGGGTFIGLGEKIRGQGAYADLFVTHGIFSKGTTELKKIYKNVYTTNTRDIHERNDVYVFDIVKGMIDYV
jgi:ribose-phosphate pyrophosphokinase